jgi:hypothetical protein
MSYTWTERGGWYIDARTKPMKASEARKLTASRKPSAANIYAKIRDKALSGGDVVHYNLNTEMEKKYAEELMNELIENGYEVSREIGDDQRERKSWDYLCITW